MFAREFTHTDQQLLDHFKAYRTSGSPLDRAVQAMTVEMKLDRPIEVFISRSQHLNAQMTTSQGGYRIIATEPLMKALGSHPHMRPSAEFKAVLGHEIGHLAEGFHKPYIYGGMLPMVALPMVAMLAYHYIVRAHQKQVPPHEAQDFIRNADAAHLPGYFETGSPTNPHEHEMNDTAKELAVGALGFGAGAGVAKLNSNLLEYRCDGWGAKMSSPQAMANALRKMVDVCKKQVEAGLTIPDSDPFAYGNAKSWLEKRCADFIQETVSSHPKMANRIKTLERMASTAAHMVR